MSAPGLERAPRAVGSGALSDPHHDGSDLCLLEQPRRLGDDAVVRLRVPHGSAADAVALRYVADGEPRVARAEVDQESETETWWRVAFPITNPLTRYRWLLTGGDVGHAWLNGLGLSRYERPDSDDFVLGVDPGGPEWHLRSVVYEVFPDRFASSGAVGEPPAWALRRDWQDLPEGRGPETAREWFGGDLAGLERHLDHLELLGASALYLTPIFPAGSTHRYDASSFDHVDPLLGGDEALASLTAAAHARGMRVIGDVTLNHTGNGHAWFRSAEGDGAAAERDFYLFDESLETGYACWLGVPSLPKLNWQSGELKARMTEVVQRWLRPPFDLDGWRVDVANMTGRYGDVDVNAHVARAMRAAVTEAKGDALLVAEHGHDFRSDLGPGSWHGAMNYSGFLRPVWWWLRSHAFDEDPFLDARAPRLDGAGAVATMRAYRAGVPWHSVLHSWTLLDSHDTARFRTVTGSRERQVVGVGLQMTTPGVPMVFAGAEIGLEGEWGEDARRTMPWDRPELWDRSLLDHYRGLVALRRSSAALARGGIRYAHVGRDAVAYLRETGAERLLCLASRDAHEPVRLSLAALGCGELEPVIGDGPGYTGGDVILPADGPSFHVWRLV
ncbi:MAG: glycoside hydrolase family 13 protein [Actinobacteria bacterium]|nr:glycoside hydrolase family 13 protein [Actinomycetota bacterium]